MQKHIVGKLKGKGWEATLTSAGWQCANPDYAAALKHYEPDVYRLWAEDARYDQRAWGVGALIAAGKALKARVFIRKALLIDRQGEAFGGSTQQEDKRR